MVTQGQRTTYVETRPWGFFQQFTYNELSTVKILVVHPGQALSLQFHNCRDEFWKILQGNPLITLEEEREGKQGDEFFISRGTKHRIQAQEETVYVLEIAFGKFDENDIVRLKDNYERV